MRINKKSLIITILILGTTVTGCRHIEFNQNQTLPEEATLASEEQPIVEKELTSDEPVIIINDNSTYKDNSQPQDTQSVIKTTETAINKQILEEKNGKYSPADSTYIKAVLDGINSVRTDKGISTSIVEKSLESSSQTRANQMASEGVTSYKSSLNFTEITCSINSLTIEQCVQAGKSLATSYNVLENKLCYVGVGVSISDNNEIFICVHTH